MNEVKKQKPYPRAIVPRQKQRHRRRKTAPERITISIAPLENTSAQKPAYT